MLNKGEGRKGGCGPRRVLAEASPASSIVVLSATMLS